MLVSRQRLVALGEGANLLVSWRRLLPSAKVPTCLSRGSVGSISSCRAIILASRPPSNPGRLTDASWGHRSAVSTAPTAVYDVGPIYDGCEERDCPPIIPLRHTVAVERGDHKPPTCEHGEWRFAGSDSKRGASNWRCPTGECKPASVWIKADCVHPLVPRDSHRFTTPYRRRFSGDREFGRVKNEWALAPLRVRGLDRVRLHADLRILATLACALSRERAIGLKVA